MKTDYCRRPFCRGSQRFIQFYEEEAREGGEGVSVIFDKVLFEILEVSP